MKTKTKKTEPRNEAKYLSGTTCMVPGCGNKAKWRDICDRCRATCKALIREGKTTWADMEARGLVGPAPPRGPKAASKRVLASRAARDEWFSKV